MTVAAGRRERRQHCEFRLRATKSVCQVRVFAHHADSESAEVSCRPFDI
jgi:hypothetical protein